MLEALIQTSQLILSVLFLFFLTGYAFLRAVFAAKNPFNSLETALFSFGAGLVIMDALMLLLGKAGISLNAASVSLAATIFVFSCVLFFLSRKGVRHWRSFLTPPAPAFSGKNALAVLAIFSLALFIKTIYLTDAVTPTSTDMGHHMYWVQAVVKTGELPHYAEKDIVSADGSFRIGESEPIADFIIGEHLPFAALSLLSTLDVLSVMPLALLLLVHMAALLSILALAKEAFWEMPGGRAATLLAFFLIAPLYAISSSQAKFISGGVVGNTFGNFLIPLVILLLAKARRTKDAKALSLALFLAAGLAYTHHLSTFVLLFVLLFGIALYGASHLKILWGELRVWLKLSFSLPVAIALGGVAVFVFAIYTPTYLNTSAIDTAVGAPSKSTRTGLTIAQLALNTGDARLALGLIGLVAILWGLRKQGFAFALLGGWTAAILVMTLRPALLLVDIPSTRIANYVSFPLAIAGAFGFVQLMLRLGKERPLVPSSLALALSSLLLLFVSSSGLADNAQSLGSATNAQQAVQTYHASRYLEKVTDQNDIILKDHNYLAADAWIKTFVTRDYNFPLSRAYFKRYEDPTKPREMCTLWMISTPSTKEARKCFEGTGTNYVMVNPLNDAAQLRRNFDFSQIYASDNVAIFKRTK
ncbi:MAG TPA: hypothetical protein PKA31_03110 [Candidatus Moranbacteria bacterium]|nr:hypothetical protein [Candidatus Moranbacteria bacterium]